MGSCLMKKEYIFCRWPKQVSFFSLFFKISKLRDTISSLVIYTYLRSPAGTVYSSSSLNLNNLYASLVIPPSPSLSSSFISLSYGSSLAGG